MRCGASSARRSARLVALLAARGEYERALPLARRWLELDPLHEPAHRELIRLYALNGDRAAALSQYRDCVRTLSQELGVAPVEETAALFEQVSEGTLRPAGAGRARRRPPPRRAPPRPSCRWWAATSELAALVAAHAAAAPDGRLAVIEGEAGIGKTRLAAGAVARARASGGAIVLAARCHDDEAGLPYGPVVELLRRGAASGAGGAGRRCPPQRLADASLLLPELAALAARPAARRCRSRGPGARHAAARGRGRGAGRRLRRAPRPGCVFVDDVHAADEATLDVLAYLGRRLRGRPLLLAVSWRSEGVPPGHRLRRLAADLSREGAATIVRLARLDEQRGGASWCARSRPRRRRRSSSGASTSRARACRCSWPSTSRRCAPASRPARSCPREVRSLLGARLAGLGAVAQQVLGAAAVIGRSFGLDTVREASGRGDEEAVSGARGAGRAAASCASCPAPEPAYDFSHQKLRALVYEEIGLARRRLLHRRVADALSRARAATSAPRSWRSTCGWRGDQAEAAEQHRLAAEHAASLLAHADALEHLEAALALGYPDPAGLHERIGDLRTLRGRLRAARWPATRARRPTASRRALAAIEHKLGDVHERRGEWERAEARFAAALEAAPPDDDAPAGAHPGRPQPDAAPGRAARAGRRAGRARRARWPRRPATGAPRPRRTTCSACSRAAPATSSRRAPSSSAASALAEELGRPARARGRAEQPRARRARRRRARPRARADRAGALALCAAHGDRHREAALHNNLADLHHAAGRPDESMDHLKRAVAIFSEVGADEATRLPEIWKLVSW